MKEQKKNILERYMQGLINEEEYNEFSQMVLDENDEKIFDLMDECICKNTNAYVMPSDVKLNLYDRIWEQIRKENIRVRLRKISSLAASILLPLFIFRQYISIFRSMSINIGLMLLLPRMAKKPNSHCPMVARCI